MAEVAILAPADAGDDQPSYLTPAPLRADNPLLKRSRDYTGINVSDWMLYPEFTAGGVYNDNLGLAPTKPVAALGARLAPDLLALRDVGPSRTIAFGSAEALLYPQAPRADTLTGRVGLSESYQISHDFLIKGEAEFDRVANLVYGGAVIGPGGSTASLIAPLQYDQAQASLAAQKTFGRFFLGVSVTTVNTDYDPLATSAGSLAQNNRDNLTTTLTQRGGYWISPLLYGYAETAENWRQYSGSQDGSQGFRAVAGLGSDRLGLFRGEIYAGYQQQYYAAAALGSAGSPVFGGKLYWYPTRAWTLSTSLDETFSDSSNPTPTNVRGAPAVVDTARLDATYQLHRQWSALGEVRFDRSRYIGSPRLDDAVSASGSVSYELARDINLSLGYSYVDVSSNATGGSYRDDIVNLGALYKF